MSSRHLARAIILQVLFMWDFYQESFPDIDFYIDYNCKHLCSFNPDKNFISFLIKKVLKNRLKLDNIINNYTKEWPVERLTRIDRNILRLALCEIFYCSKTPTKVCLNEAVELAFQYGGQSSKKFVSGVLGSVYEDYFKDNEKRRIKIRESFKD